MEQSHLADHRSRPLHRQQHLAVGGLLQDLDLALDDHVRGITVVTLSEVPRSLEEVYLRIVENKQGEVGPDQFSEVS